jgi:hypothetical protein
VLFMVWIRIHLSGSWLKGLCTLMVAVALSACAKASPSGAANAEDCEHSLPATGSVQKVSHPLKPSVCRAVILMCNYCAFDAQGGFTGAGSEPCGACIGAEF